MAIDSAAKRKSCIGIALLFLRTGVIPDDADLEAGQRLHTQGLYNGIASEGPVVLTGGGFMMAVMARRRGRR